MWTFNKPTEKPYERRPWNKGKIVGPKPPLQPRHVWAIRTRLQLAGKTRDLALFNLAIDSKLRGCDVVSLKVEDVAPNGCAIERATVRQKKTGRPVKFEITEQTRQAIDAHIMARGKKPGDYLFSGRDCPHPRAFLHSQDPNRTSGLNELVSPRRIEMRGPRAMRKRRPIMN